MGGLSPALSKMGDASPPSPPPVAEPLAAIYILTASSLGQEYNFRAVCLIIVPSFYALSYMRDSPIKRCCLNSIRFRVQPHLSVHLRSCTGRRPGRHSSGSRPRSRLRIYPEWDCPGVSWCTNPLFRVLGQEAHAYRLLRGSDVRRLS